MGNYLYKAPMLRKPAPTCALQCSAHPRVLSSKRRPWLKKHAIKRSLPGLSPGGRTFDYHDAAGMAALPASGCVRAQGLMRAALLHALLPLALLLLLTGRAGAQRPSYSPISAQYYIKNNYLVLDLVYDNFQGYFLNTYTLPAGAARVQSTVMLALTHLLAKSRILQAAQSCKCAAAGTRVTDQTSGKTWWPAKDIVLTTQPVSWADQDRLGVHHLCDATTDLFLLQNGLLGTEQAASFSRDALICCLRNIWMSPLPSMVSSHGPSCGEGKAKRSSS